MSAVIVKTKVTTTPTTTSGTLNPILLKGTWFQIARWGIHEDLFKGVAYTEWTLIPRDDRYFSLSVETSDGITRLLSEGYATVTPEGIMSIILNIGEDVVSLGEYLIHYTDYSQYIFLGAPNDLLVWSRKSFIRPGEVPIILAKTESYDYAGAQLYVNRAFLSAANTKSPLATATAILTVAPAIPFSNSSRGDTQTRINTKVSLADYDDDDEEDDFLKDPVANSTQQDDWYDRPSIVPYERGRVVTIRR